MIVSCVPVSFDDLDLVEESDLHAAPLAAVRQALRALASKLEEETLLSTFGMTKRMRAHFALSALVYGEHLMSLDDRRTN
jgi:hypothetical protein